MKGNAVFAFVNGYNAVDYCVEQGQAQEHLVVSGKHGGKDSEERQHH
jgi:hypothetical protein